MNMKTKFKVFYDDQCEICQSGASWLRLIDDKNRIEFVSIEPCFLLSHYPDLDPEACQRELHVIAPDGRLYRGWEAVSRLARLFPQTWLVGMLGTLPLFMQLGRALYRSLAANRYALSKCHGGACRTHQPDPRQLKAALRIFWLCYLVGFFLRLPLVIGSGVCEFVRRLIAFFKTFRQGYEFLGSKLRLFFLCGFPCDLVPLFFGENFIMAVYKGIAVDPGSPRMRKSLQTHLDRLEPGAIRSIVATHHHEEHVGNLNWVAEKTGATIHLPEATARLLTHPVRLPWIRRIFIGQPPPLRKPYKFLGEEFAIDGSVLRVIPTPGHCDDHVVLYDPEEKLLIAGDAFMGAYFSTPNPDVDSLKWIGTIRRLLELDIEILIEGHGHIHTLRPDIPDIAGVVVREDPRSILDQKLKFLLWVREQVESGMAEKLPISAIASTCFPWNRATTWESFLNNELVECLSMGHFSKKELVRSFVRAPSNDHVFPTVYKTVFYR